MHDTSSCLGPAAPHCWPGFQRQRLKFNMAQQGWGCVRFRDGMIGRQQFGGRPREWHLVPFLAKLVHSCVNTLSTFPAMAVGYVMAHVNSSAMDTNEPGSAGTESVCVCDLNPLDLIDAHQV